MLSISDDRYETCLKVAQEVFGSDPKRWDTDELLLAIDLRIERGDLPASFWPSKDAAWGRAKRELIAAFFFRWEREQWAPKGRTLLGVPARRNGGHGVYLNLDGRKSIGPEARIETMVQVKMATTMLIKYLPRCGLSLPQIKEWLRDIEAQVEAAWPKQKVKVGP